MRQCQAVDGANLQHSQLGQFAQLSKVKGYVGPAGKNKTTIVFFLIQHGRTTLKESTKYLVQD